MTIALTLKRKDHKLIVETVPITLIGQELVESKGLIQEDQSITQTHLDHVISLEFVEIGHVGIVETEEIEKE